MGGNAQDPHALADVFDDGEDVDAAAVEQGDGEEVGRRGSPSPDCAGTPPRSAPTCSARRRPRATYDDAVAVLEDAAQIPAYRLAQDVAIEKILAALAATRDGLATRPRRPDPRTMPGADR